MAFVLNQAAPQPMFIEQAPPPVIVQAAPQPMFIEQAPPPVIVQAAPQPMFIEQALPPVIVQAQPAAVVVQPPDPVVHSPLKCVPARTRCGFCQQQVVTKTRPINGLLTWTLFGSLLVLLMWPCCLIPLFSKTCKDIEHTCPECKNVIHVHKRM